MRHDRIGISAGQRLERALVELCGDDSHCLEAQETPWASATFTGHRHAFRLRLTGRDAPGRVRVLAARLPDIEYDLPRVLVAEIVVLAHGASTPGCADLEIEALTINEN